MRKLLTVIYCFLTAASVQAQNSMPAQKISVEEYIATYKDIAIAEMKRSGIPASITLAQGILETENGNSILVKKSNNHFGIKCKSNWIGESVLHTDDAVDECFRKYTSAAISYRDHSDFLRNNVRYATLFKLSPDDYKGWAYGLKKAGYATNPKYPNILITNIERYNLQAYDRGETGTVVFDEGKFTGQDTTQQLTIAPATPEEIKITEDLAPTKPVKTMFNSLKAVFATRGTSLLAIATNTGLHLSKLLEYNDLTHDGLLKEDQWVYLERKKKAGNRDVYTALQNESLYNISQNNAIQLEYLATYNQLAQDANVLKGTIVKLRPGPEVARPLTVAVSTTKIHEVQPKEGLYSIAKKYNVSVQDIRQWNNLPAGDLKVGQQLIISK
jgi:LysM repeat protein